MNQQKHLAPPGSTPQTRRKRGLSLRSQLFNKAVALTFDPRPVPNTHIQKGSTFELGEITPQANVDTVEESNTHKAYPPNNARLNMTRSTTHLTTISSFNSEEELPPRGERSTRLFRRRRARGIYRAYLKRFKDRILGRAELGPSANGRVVPLLVNKLAEYYNANTKGYVDERTGDGYCSNVITSSRYNIYTFFPKQLKAQFSKLANCYFMAVAIMQLIPSWSTTGHYTTIVPLLIFMSISMAREAFDDWKRHTHDKEENSKSAHVVREDDLSLFDTHLIATIMTHSTVVTETIPTFMTEAAESEEETSSVSSNTPFGRNIFSNSNLMCRYNLKLYPAKWKDIKVGDIIQVKENEWLPADILLLAVDSDDTEAYVETMALDGETNLKLKFAHPELSKITSKVTELKNAKAVVTVEDPNPDLYNFEGHFSLKGEDYALGPDNVIYRGSILRNTRSVLGLVVFSGEESKIRMNNLRNPRTKAPKLQRNINYIVLFMIFVVISLSAFSTMAQVIFRKRDLPNAWYLENQDVGVAATLMGYIIMYNTLIPLSLYVTMEIIKVMQLLFLQYDIDMYHVESDTPAEAKTATILEELGQVSYIFSDKTGTLTDNVMIFRKFSVCGTSWIHDVDLISKERGNSNIVPIQSNRVVSPRNSISSLVRDSVELTSVVSRTTWKSSAQPEKLQNLGNSLDLLKYLQTHSQTIFSKRATFFLLSIALCHTCQPRKEIKNQSTNNSAYSLDDSFEDTNLTDIEVDSSIVYQAASPDELALVEAARDLGFIVMDKQNSIINVKTYPQGFNSPAKIEKYEILDVIEFTSVRKRMSIVMSFPDSRIGVICKGADNIILDKLKNSHLAKQKAKEISLNSADRKTLEAEVVLQSKLSAELDSRRSISSFRNSSDIVHRLNASLDGFALKTELDINEIANKARKSLHIQQGKRYSLEDSSQSKGSKTFVPSDNLLLNEEFVIEKTLEHIEEFSTEGLRTLLYSFKWLSKNDYDVWAQEYHEAKLALVDRAKKVEEVGGKIEFNFELLGATAIEDKLQEGVSETIEKLRAAGIKLWMLTGDKRETAINIGYSCRLIKDYSTVVILTLDEGSEKLAQRINTASREVKAGRIAHCVVVVDGATLADIETDPTLLSIFIELSIEVDSAICCRASPSQKASMINAVRKIRTRDVTLAIGDGANDIAMIQSADIGVGITGKEGLQAARSADYAIAQFRFLQKLLLVNGRYNYVRTAKFVLCTFYKELLFYLTQCVYQKYTLFTGSSMYESWSLSMFNTLFTSLPVICIGMFDKDLKPSTLLAVPELYATGRLYQAFNLKIFLFWMTLAAFQSVAVSFLAYFTWGFSALRDNTTLPLGTMVFFALVIVINTKIQFLEMRNKNWLAFCSFIISVAGYGIWNVLIMSLHRSGLGTTIFYVDYGLMEFGADITWWATLMLLFTILLLFDLLIKVNKFIFAPNDTELFQLFERDVELRRMFEEKSLSELHQGWFFVKQSSTTLKSLGSVFKKIFGSSLADVVEAPPAEEIGSAAHRKRAGTNPHSTELQPSGEGTVVKESDFEQLAYDGYEVLPSGAKLKIKKDGMFAKLGKRLRKEEAEDVDKIIDNRMKELGRTD